MTSARAANIQSISATTQFYLLGNAFMAVIYAYFALQSQAWQMWVLCGVAVLFVGACRYVIHLAQTKRPHTGAWLLILMMMGFTAGLTPALLAKTGLILGVLSIITNLAVAPQILPARHFNRILLLSCLTSVAAGALDYYQLPTQVSLPNVNRVLFLVSFIGGVAGVFITARRFFSYSLTSKLVLAFLAVAMLPLSFLVGLTTLNTNTTLTDKANQTLLNAAAQTATVLDSFIDANLSALRTEAHLPVLVKFLQVPPTQRATSALVPEVLETLLTLKRKEETHIFSYALLDRSGFIVADTVSTNIGQVEAEADSFQAPLAMGRPYVSPVYFLPTGAYWFFSAPVYADSGEALGVLRVSYQASILQQKIIRSIQGLAGEQSFAILLDENLLQLAEGGEPTQYFEFISPPTPERLAALQAAGRAPPGLPPTRRPPLRSFEENARHDQPNAVFSSPLEPGGELYNVAVQSLRLQTWRVAFVQPQAIVFAPINNQARAALLLAIVFAGGVAAVAILLGERIADPIHNLTFVAQQMALGDLTARARVPSRDEIGSLTTTFNAMAAQLQANLTGLEQRVTERTEALAEANTHLQQEINERERAEVLLQQQNAYLSALHDTTLALLHRHALNDLLETVLTRAGQLLSVTHGFIYLVSADGLALEYKVGLGTFNYPETIRRGQGLAGTAWQTGQIKAVDDYAQWAGRLTNIDSHQLRSVVALPLTRTVEVGVEIVGILGMGYQADQARAFGPTEIELLSRFAQLASVVLDNTQLFETTTQLYREAQQRVAELAAINAISQTITANQDLNTTLFAVGEKVQVIFKVEVIFIALYYPATNLIDFPYFAVNGEHIPSLPLRLGEGLTSTVIRSRNTLLINADYPRRAVELGARQIADQVPKSWLGVPIIVGQEVMGVISAQSLNHENYFTDDHVRLLNTIAANIGAALQSAQLFQEVKHRAEEMAALAEVGREISSTLDLAAVLEKLATRARVLLKASSADLRLLETDGQTLKVMVALGEFADELRANTIRLGEGLTGSIAQAGQAEIIPNVDLDPRRLQIPGTPDDDPESMLCAPLLSRGRVIGTLSVWRSVRSGVFTQAELDFLVGLSRQAVIGIENARLYAESQRRLAEMAVINDISQTISAQLDLENVIYLIGEKVRAVFGVEVVSIALYHAATQQIAFPYLSVRGEYKEVPMLTLGRGLTSVVIETRQPLLINEDYDRRAAELGAQQLVADVPRAWLGVPVLTGLEATGVLTVQSLSQEGRFTEGDTRLLTTIAANIGTAIQNAQLYQEAQRRAEEMAALAEVGREVLGTLDLSTVLERIARRAQELLKGSSADLCLLEPDGETLKVVVAVGEFADEIKASTLKVGEGVTGDVARRGVPEIVNNLLTDPRSMQVNGTPEEEDPEALLVAPLIARDQVIGTMSIWRRLRDGAFNQNELDFLVGLTRQTVIAIENARLFASAQQELAERKQAEAALLKTRDALEQRVEQLSLISQVGRYATVLRGRQDSLPEIVELIRASFNYYAVMLFIVDHDQRVAHLRTAATAEKVDLLTDGLVVPFGEALTGYAAAQGMSIAVNDVSHSPLYKADPRLPAVRSELALPLRVGHEVLGVLDLESAELNTFHSTNTQVWEILGDQIAVAVYNARLFQAEAEARHAADNLRMVGQIVSSTLDLDEVLTRILESLSAVLEYDSATIMLLHDQTFHVRAGRGFQNSELVSDLRLPLEGFPLNREIVESRQPIIINDVREDARWGGGKIPITLPIRAWMGIPLITSGEVIGMLAIDSYAPNTYNTKHLPLVTAFATQAAIAIRNAEFFKAAEKARSEAEEANRLKTQFLANMSHELRTPLNSIINFAYLLSMGIEGDTTPGQLDLLTRIDEAGRHLLGLINDILDLAKIEAGRLELMLEDVDLHEMLEGVMSTAVGLLRGKPIELTREVPDQLPLVRGDRTRIRQVLLNLLSNSAKFTAQGHIIVRANADTQWVTLSVEDTGIGIAPEDLPRAFAEFVQIDGGMTRQVGGTGLGLPISKRFVEMHGGKMWAESAPNVGSTFYFTLPCANAEPIPLPSDNLPSEARVLIIDDDPDSRDTIEHQLANHYHVFKLNDSRQVVERAQELAPDVIVLDVMMPHQDGWEVLKALKAHSATQDIPVIMCSVLHEQQLALSLAADDYLVKPVDRELLRHLLARLAPPGGKVLAVDDDPNALEIVRRMLDGMTYVVSTAQDGLSGLQAARTQGPDVVVLDLMMPGLSGFEVLSALRADQATAQLPVIIVTAKDLTREEYDQLQAGAAALLQKGQFTAEELVNAVRRAVARGVGKNR